MDTPAAAALLPAGLSDVLPPFAAFEAGTVERLLAQFAGYGYQRIKPPLIEFEDTLLAGAGSALASDTFRLMDPISQRMLALRPDMTMQVARIASSRLGHWPRPLRLSYAGQVLRVRGTHVRPERQFGQVGAELIGSPSSAADVEVIVIATAALADLGLDGLTVDLGLPPLIPMILAESDWNAVSGRLHAALDRKDSAAIEDLAPLLGADRARMLTTLIGSAGPAERAVTALAALDLPPAAADQRAQLIAVYEGLRREAPDLTITIDTVEHRGFEYHTGVTYALFAAKAPGELGRGGRYCSAAGEPATGVTLFMDAVLRALPRPAPSARVLLPAGTSAADACRLRREGWIAIAALQPLTDPAAEAVRLGCSHVLVGSEPRSVHDRLTTHQKPTTPQKED